MPDHRTGELGSAATCPPLFGWIWEPVVSHLRKVNAALVDSPAAAVAFSPPGGKPIYVLGNALFALEPARIACNSICWFIDDPANAAEITERHVAAIERVYSPLLPDELPLPARLPAAIQSAWLQHVSFCPFPGGVANANTTPVLRPPAFDVGFIELRGLPPLEFWAVHLHRDGSFPITLSAIGAALAAKDAPQGFWLLLPPLDELSAERVAFLERAGVTPVPCSSLRGGVTAALRRSPPTRKRPELADELIEGWRQPCFRLEPAAIAHRTQLPFPPVATAGATPPGEFEVALARWSGTETDLGVLARSLVETTGWRDPSLASRLGGRLHAVSSSAPGTFVAAVLARCPLTALYHARDASTREIARFGLEVLGSAESVTIGDTATETIRLLLHVATEDLAAFAASYTAAEPRLNARYRLGSVSLAVLGGLAWPLPQLVVSGMTTGEVPPALLLSAAFGYAQRSRHTEALTLIELLHQVAPKFLLRAPVDSRWNRLLLWAALARTWNNTDVADAAIRWVRSTDFTFADQAFLLERALSRVPGESPPLPVFELPWSHE